MQCPRERRQNYIRHIQSLSRASRCMCFMKIMQKWENNEIEEIMLVLQPHLNSAPTGPMQAFSEMLPLSGNLVSWSQRAFLIQTPQGWRPLISVKWNIHWKSSTFYIHNIEHAANTIPNIQVPVRQTLLCQSCQNKAGSFPIKGQFG